MSNIVIVIEQMKEQWTEPKYPNNKDGSLEPFLLSCSFYTATTSTKATFRKKIAIPKDLQIFWALYDNAELFRDITYGQWGLDILSIEDAIAYSKRGRIYRPSAFKNTDLIIGSFRGDSDLLMINCNEHANNYGQITVVLPIDDRPDWYVVADSLSEFLELYAKCNGEKFWA